MQLSKYLIQKSFVFIITNALLLNRGDELLSCVNAQQIAENKLILKNERINYIHNFLRKENLNLINEGNRIIEELHE